jgi:hypothetical protein
MSVPKLTNFASFLCKFLVEARDQSGLRYAHSILSRSGRFVLCLSWHTDLLRAKVITFLPALLLHQIFSSDGDDITESSVTFSI